MFMPKYDFASLNFISSSVITKRVFFQIEHFRPITVFFFLSLRVEHLNKITEMVFQGEKLKCAAS